MEMRCYRKLLQISYKDHVTNEEVRAKILLCEHYLARANTQSYVEQY